MVSSLNSQYKAGYLVSDGGFRNEKIFSFGFNFCRWCVCRYSIYQYGEDNEGRLFWSLALHYQEIPSMRQFLR